MRGAPLRDSFLGIGFLVSCVAPAALAAESASSRQPLAVSARILTACGMTTKEAAAAGVRIRCTGEVTLQAPAEVSLARRHEGSATIFNAQIVPSTPSEPRVVTLLF